MNLEKHNPLSMAGLLVAMSNPVFLIKEKPENGFVVCESYQNTIDYILEHQGCGVKEIAAEFGVHQSKISNQINKMLRREGCPIVRTGKTKWFRFHIKDEQ